MWEEKVCSPSSPSPSSPSLPTCWVEQYPVSVGPALKNPNPRLREEDAACRRKGESESDQRWW